MARPLRVEYQGAIYHVTVRGNARRAIFGDDRRMYLEMLKALAETMRQDLGDGRKPGKNRRPPGKI